MILGAGFALESVVQAQAGDPVNVLPPRLQPCTGGMQPPVPLGSKSRWITYDDYPSSALRQEQQGKVYVVITVGVDGRVRDVEVTSSSAGPVLDQATITVIKRRARFMPAMNKCQPVDGEYETALNWVLPE